MEYAFQESPEKKPDSGKKGVLEQLGILKEGVDTKSQVLELAKSLGAFFAGENKEKSSPPASSQPQKQEPANKPAFIPAARRIDDKREDDPSVEGDQVTRRTASDRYKRKTFSPTFEERNQNKDLHGIKNAETVSTTGPLSKRLERYLKTHQQDAPKLRIMNERKGQLNAFLNKYEKYKPKYDLVAKYTGLPARLIACIHYLESGMNFNTYLHNGQPLGKETTIVPKGILFKKGEWEKAAIHALGGDITDHNGKRSKNRFAELRKGLGINPDTTDPSKLMLFAERYNGFGYRGKKGKRSNYIFAGSNLQTKGRYVADGKWNENATSNRIGVGVMLRGIAEMEGQSWPSSSSAIA